MAEDKLVRSWWSLLWTGSAKRSFGEDNRLNLGKELYLKGAIENAEVNDGRIYASVKNSDQPAASFHTIIKLHHLSEAEKEILTGVITGNPSLVLELSLGSFPEELEDELKKQNVCLFPDNLNDMEASCSCPNEGFCEHTASLIYFIAWEIERNPLLFLNLKGIDPASLMEKAGLVSSVALAGGNSYGHNFTHPDTIKPSEGYNEGADADLSFEELDIRALFMLLPENPLFYREGDFKLMLIEKYKALSQFASGFSLNDMNVPDLSASDFYLLFGTRYELSRSSARPAEAVNGEELISAFAVNPERYIPQIKTRQEFNNYTVPCVKDGKMSTETRRLKIAEYEDVMNFFLSLPLDLSLKNNTPSVRFLNLACSISLSLIKSFSYIPEVVSLDEGKFYIHYIPLIHNEKIRQAVETLKAVTPPSFGFRLGDMHILNHELHITILSIIITYLVNSHDRRYGRNYYFTDQKIYYTFFRGQLFIPENFAEKGTVKMTVDWLERLAFRKREFCPVINIESLGHDKYSVRIDVSSDKLKDFEDITLAELFEREENLAGFDINSVRTELLREIKIAAEYFPALDEILNSKGLQQAVINSEGMYEFVTSVQQVFNLLGIGTSLPREIRKMASPKVVISGSLKDSGAQVSYFTLKDLLKFEWQIALGDNVVSAEEFRRLTAEVKGIIRIKDQYMLIRPDEVAGILEQVSRPPENLTPVQMLQTALTGELNGQTFVPDALLEDKIRGLLSPEEISLPEGLMTELRHYQMRGFKWIYSNSVKGLGSCLADDMGLGKTVQVIACLLRMKQDGLLSGKPALVICPTTLAANWYKELSRFAPSLEVFVYHGSQRRLNTKNKDVVITTYGVARRDSEKFSKFSWGMIIIDEAQNIKNPDADQTVAVKSIFSDKHVALTGTPVENRLSELWSIFDFINPGYLGTLGSFKRTYAVPIEKYRNHEKIERLRKITAPFIMRRLKSDESIAPELPEKFIFDEYCYLSKEQTALYEQVVKDTLNEISSVSGIERKGLIFKLITSLKQICNHPSHYSGNENLRPEDSGKAEKLMELLGRMLPKGEKVLIFTQYKEMGDLLGQMIRQSMKEESYFFHGSLSVTQRDEMVTSFQEDPAVKIMILSLKAGGTGLNLTAAARVIHYDLWWNPAVENQATDRSYRIGQEKNVTVHRLLTLGTFEEKIDDMIRQKRELAELALSTGENWITELSDRELKSIFSLKTGEKRKTRKQDALKKKKTEAENSAENREQ